MPGNHIANEHRRIQQFARDWKRIVLCQAHGCCVEHQSTSRRIGWANACTTPGEFGNKSVQAGCARFVGIVDDELTHACFEQSDSDRAARSPGAQQQCTAVFHARTVIDLRFYERESVEHIAVPCSVRIAPHDTYST